MQDKLIDIKNEALGRIIEAKTSEELEDVRVDYLGKSKGKITLIIKEIPKLSPEEKGIVGKFANEVKTIIEQALERQIVLVQKDKVSNIEKTEWIDVTKPAIFPPEGHLHPFTQTLHDALNIFKELGFQATSAFEIETDYYNFTALNMPKDAPSRDTQATFYLSEDKLLHTQTSSMQVRIMEKTKPPIRVVVPGKCFRIDDVDASHGFEFWQLEGMLVDKNIKVTDLLGTLEHFSKRIFSDDVKVRFEATHFAFTEPSLQGYVSCTVCKQKGCSFCKQTGWVEVYPAGMIHPNVLKNGGLDPKEWNGFAFGLGISRIAVLKYQIDDIRTFTNPDLRILKQF